jgi:hypothetical protein
MVRARAHVRTGVGVGCPPTLADRTEAGHFHGAPAHLHCVTVDALEYWSTRVLEDRDARARVHVPGVPRDPSISLARQPCRAASDLTMPCRHYRVRARSSEPNANYHNGG